jgi:hypothetical protein
VQASMIHRSKRGLLAAAYSGLDVPSGMAGVTAGHGCGSRYLQDTSTTVESMWV